MGGEPEPVELEISGETMSSIRLTAEGEGRSEVIALVFNEKVADEIGEFLADRWPLPVDCVIEVRLESVHADKLEEWIRDGM